VILAGAMAFVALVAIVASAFPALRASSVHPTEALRVD
jgi:ABC-type lipoprotein release transport system permease subunit